MPRSRSSTSASCSHHLIRRVGRATGALVKIGAGLLSSLFALITILILSIFLVSRGPVWVERAVASRPPDQAAALRSALRRIADAVSAYVGGAIARALCDLIEKIAFPAKATAIAQAIHRWAPRKDLDVSRCRRLVDSCG